MVNVYVFPGKDGTGSPVEPKRRIARVNEVGNVVFTLHDLHRTFATIAEGLDITGYTLKRLLDHTIHGDRDRWLWRHRRVPLRRSLHAVAGRSLCPPSAARARRTEVSAPLEYSRAMAGNHGFVRMGTQVIVTSSALISTALIPIIARSRSVSCCASASDKGSSRCSRRRLTTTWPVCFGAGSPGKPMYR